MAYQNQLIFDKPLREIARLFAIVHIVEERQRVLPPSRGVLPVTVQCFLDDYRAEQTLRRDMTLLWEAGYLERIGKKAGARRGYRVAGAPMVVERGLLRLNVNVRMMG